MTPRASSRLNVWLALDALLVSGQDVAPVLVGGAAADFAREQLLAFRLGVLEVLEQRFGRRVFEIVAGLFDFVLMIDVAPAHEVRRLAVHRVVGEVEAVIDALHVHRQAFEAVGDFGRDGAAVDAADLLEVGELRHLHAVAPDFPAQTPGAQRRAIPNRLRRSGCRVRRSEMPSAFSEPR